MARVSSRLPWVSTDGPDPVFVVPTQAWPELEAEFGRTLSSEARDELETRCSAYFRRRRNEQNAATEKEVQDYVDLISRSIAPFIKFAVNDVSDILPADGNDDAWSEFENRFDLEISSDFNVLELSSSSLMRRVISDTGFAYHEMESKDVVLRLSPVTLTEIAIRLGSTMRNLKKGPGEHSSGFRQGDAFAGLLISLRNWAKTFNFRYGAYNSGKALAGPVPRLCFALNNLFPEQFRERQLNSPEAVAKRMERVVKAARQSENTTK